MQKRTLYKVVWQVDGQPAQSIQTVSKHVRDAIWDVVREENLDDNTLLYIQATRIGDIWA